MAKDLVNAVAEARQQQQQVCANFEWHGNCRKGGKCKHRHPGSSDQTLTLPHVSFHMGSVRPYKITMTLRPPFDKGWEHFFQAASLPRRVLSGGQRFGSKILYQLAYMAESDKVLCVQTRSQAFVQQGGRTWGVSPKAFPDYLSHICSYPQAMSILKAGAISTGVESECGKGGVLGRRIDVESQAMLPAAASQTWDMAAATSDFADGPCCMFVLACNGCLINGSWTTDIVPGSIAVKNAHYAAHPTTFDFVGVMFEFTDLVEFLVPHMLAANTGYTMELHSSLVACQQWLHSQPQAGDDRPSCSFKLLNAITMEGGQDNQDKQRALKLSEKAARTAEGQRLAQQREANWQRQGAAEERRRQQQQWQAQTDTQAKGYQ